MIIITGAAGFIGSCLVTELNRRGRNDLILADDFSKTEKQHNYIDKSYQLLLNRSELQRFLETSPDVEFIFHIGARTDTTEFDKTIFDELNYRYSKMIWQFCTRHQVPLVYASSAATYGDGNEGYDDNTSPQILHPLNPYGISKNEFDKFVLEEINAGHQTPPSWYGLKFFNVYGPNEYHKARMASVIFHAFHQFRQTGKVKLFRSHRNDFEDGKQMRDFVYVKDVIDVLLWLYDIHPASGIYNLGTGEARTFYDLAFSTANAMNIPLQIDWIDMPEDIRDKYQYFTEAKMEKLKAAGYRKKFHSLEDGIHDYVTDYLMPGKYL